MRLEEATIAATAVALELQHPRILADLGVESMPVVTITLYADRASFLAGVGSRAGYIPAFATGVVTGVDQIHLVPGTGGLTTRLVHEFAHCVSIRANPTIPNNPRWLWETIAIYESEARARERGITLVTGVDPPSLSSLNSIDNVAIYDVGFLLGEFIVSAFGQPALRSLLATNGNVAQGLDLSEREFEMRWVAFVRDRYSV